MYMVTTAAKTSHKVLDKDPSNARAAPWNSLWMLTGMPLSFKLDSSCLTAATACPKATPLAGAKDKVMLGNCAKWSMLKRAGFSITRTTLASAV